MVKWLTTFVRQWRLMRRKRHGGGRATLAQAAFYAACGAHLASHWGPNPTRKYSLTR